MPEPAQVDALIFWHGRLMVLAWVIVIPLGVLAARFFKVLPTQKWPQELDNQAWWLSHLICQYGAVVVTLVALALTLSSPIDLADATMWHRWLGYTTITLCALQIASGLLRGSKGGPTEPAADGSLFGDHYSMTQRRRWFETYHKTLGYVVVILSWICVLTGLQAAQAPLWMYAVIVAWWAVLVILFALLQRSGFQKDTYLAIWGHKPDQAASEPADALGTNTKGH